MKTGCTGSYAAKAHLKRRKLLQVVSSTPPEPEKKFTRPADARMTPASLFLPEHLTHTRASMTSPPVASPEPSSQWQPCSKNAAKPRQVPGTPKLRSSVVAACVRRLATPKTPTIEERQLTKRRQEDEAARRLHTGSCNEQVFQRLFEEGAAASRLKERQFSRSRDFEHLKLSFHPELCTSPAPDPPLYQRFDAVQTQRKRYKEQLKEQQVSPEFTFNPVVHPRPTAGLTPRKPTTVVDDKPSKPLHKANTVTDLLRRPVSKPRPKPSPEVWSYVPQINSHSKFLMQQRRANEKATEQLTRLSSDSRPVTREQLTAKQYSQYTFQPKLDVISSELGRAVSPRAKKSSQPPRQDPSFKPSLFRSKKYGHVKSHYQLTPDLTARIDTGLLQSTLSCRRIKQLQEFSELAACTFKPQLNKRSSVSAAHFGTVTFGPKAFNGQFGSVL